jgi:hypothetical protein
LARRSHRSGYVALSDVISAAIALRWAAVRVDATTHQRERNSHAAAGSKSDRFDAVVALLSNRYLRSNHMKIDPGLVAMKKLAVPHILQRIRAEYTEMPGLSLKPEQVQRLCGVDRAVCEAALAMLVESGFLSMRPDGAYGRFRNPEIARPRPAKASLEPSVLSTMTRERTRAN